MGAYCRGGEKNLRGKPTNVKKAKKYCVTDKAGVPKRTGKGKLRHTKSHGKAGPAKKAYVRR